MTLVLAIDPGNTESAYVLIDKDQRPVQFGKITNREMLNWIEQYAGFDALLPRGRVVVEMVASYGMAVGADVFETCVWIGRFVQRFEEFGVTAELVKRNPVKLHHCHSSKAKDGNIAQALVDRFAAGASNHGKGTKANPGWFYGFKSDIWQAYALAVYAADTAEGIAA